MAARTKAGNALPAVPKDQWDDVILATVRRIPKGWVATYGQISTMAGLGKRSRLAGHVLQQLGNKPHADIPWHRVINARGEISYSFSRDGGDVLQRRLLEGEGVEFDAKERVDLERFRWVE